MSAQIDRRDLMKSLLALPLISAAGIAGKNAYAQTNKNITRIKTSICAYSYRKYLPEANKKGTMTLDEFLELAAKLGVDGVELTFYYFPNYPEKCSDEFLYHLRRKAFLLGLEINGTAVGNNFCIFGKEKLQEEINRVKTWIESASKLGAPEMRVFGGTVPRGGSEKESVDQAVEAFKECCKHGEKYGVMLALENHGGICTSAEEVLNIIKMVDSEWIGANLDTGNFVSEDPYQEIAMIAPGALTCHVKVTVNRRTGEKVDMKRVVNILRKVNYNRYLPIEYEETEDPMTGVPKFLSEIRETLG